MSTVLVPSFTILYHLKSEELNVLLREQMDAGSVDEHSTKSDEEYDDLATRDVMANGEQHQGFTSPGEHAWNWNS
jgi:hypothetical protein